MNDILKFNRARDCLRYLVKKFEIKEMYIPYYLCDVVRHTLFEEGCKPLFYHINDDFMPASVFPKDSYILYPNYFGVCGENVKNMVTKYPKLIVDNAHAFFDKPQGFAAFNSGIKFGLGENAYLWINSEEYFDDTANYSVKYKFKAKFMEFNIKFSEKNLLKLDIDNMLCPFCYPLLASSVQEADKIVRTLTSEGLTIYRYWNPLPESYNEYKFYSRLVPIPLN